MRYLWLLLLAACGLPIADPKSEEPKPTVLFAFGDSISAGNHLPPGTDFPTLVANSLNIHIVNYAIPGSKMSDILGDIERLTLSPKSVVTLLTGFNDAFYSPPGTEDFEQYKKDLSRAVDFLTWQGQLLLIGGVLGQPQAGYVPPNKNNTVNAAIYTQTISDIANEWKAKGRRIKIVDLPAYYFPEADTSSDNQHPAARGNQHLADAFLAAYWRQE